MADMPKWYLDAAITDNLLRELMDAIKGNQVADYPTQFRGMLHQEQPPVLIETPDELRVGADRAFRFGKQPSKFSEAYNRVLEDAIKTGQGVYVVGIDPAGADSEQTIFGHWHGDQLIIDHIEPGEMVAKGAEITLSPSDYKEEK